MGLFKCFSSIRHKPSIIKVTTLAVFGLLMVSFVCAQSQMIFASVSVSNDIFTYQELNWIKDNPVIYYGPDLNYAPFEFVEDGIAKGIAPDYLKAIAEISGLKFETVIQRNWSEALALLASKDIDIMFATPDEKRKESMLFTSDVLDTPDVIIVRQGNQKQHDMESLDGARVSVIEGYITSSLLSKAHPLIEQITYKTTDEALAAVAFGEVDATIIDIGSASYSIQKNKFTNLKIASQAPFGSALAFAIRTDYEVLQSIVNKSLLKIPQKEKNQILDKWITLKQNPSWSKQQVLLITGILIFISFISWVWINILKAEVKRRTLALTLTSGTLETVIDQVPHLIFVKNLQGQFVLVNKATALFYDTSKQNLIGKTHDDFYCEDVNKNEELLSRDASVVENGTFLNIPVESSRDSLGKLYYFNVYKRSIQLEGQPYLCALTVAVDISQEIEAKKANLIHEEALKQAEYHVSDMEKKATLGSLVAGITHEINNPIGVSVTALSHLSLEFETFKKLAMDQRLTKDNLNEFLEVSDEALTILKHNIERAVNMVSSFKQMSVDQLSEAKSDFNLCNTIQHVIDSLKYECKRKNVQVNFQCHDAIWLSSYPGSYSQVLTNLLMNSLIHGFENQSNGLVTIDARQENQEIIICYADNGIGMTEELLKKVWQPYFTTKRNEGGSGLGMQIIYNIIVRTLKGTIRFLSSPNQGVNCEMRIPIHPDPKD